MDQEESEDTNHLAAIENPESNGMYIINTAIQEIIDDMIDRYIHLNID